MCDLLFFFFFSSRRRHTRFSRDWSSDVCSSDLDGVAPDNVAPLGQLADADVADCQRAGVIALNTDEPRRRQPVVRVLGELARRDTLLPVLAPELVLDDLHPVQPVLDVIALDDE